jgi:hypothetical protein
MRYTFSPDALKGSSREPPAYGPQVPPGPSPPADATPTKTGCDVLPWKVAVIWYDPRSIQVGEVAGGGVVSVQEQVKGITAVIKPVALTVAVFGGACRATPFTSAPMGTTT